MLQRKKIFCIKDCEISPVLTNGVDRTRHSIQKVTNWQTMATDQPTCKSDVMDNSHLGTYYYYLIPLKCYFMG